MQDNEETVAVCAAHLRFVPCRHGKKESPCIYSEQPNDIIATTLFQIGEEDAWRIMEKLKPELFPS